MQIKKPRMKEEIESSYASILAPYACIGPAEGSRDFEEKGMEFDNRGSFQRDRDRIIHTEAFRRLMYKTQVFVNHESDRFRTRLTHTLEVAQFARGICKSLALNEDLAEAIAFGHDLGHTPFGHAVEGYFDEVLAKRGLGHFYHNEQSVRVVDYLEVREEGERGLNLTREVREGMLKHNRDRSGIYQSLAPDQVCSSLEGQVVSMVDTIAYICHDLEDGIKAGIIEDAIYKNEDIRQNFKELEQIVYEKTGVRIDTNRYKNPLFIRKLIHFFIQELTADSWEQIQKYRVTSREDLDVCVKQNIALIGFTGDNLDFFKQFKSCIYKNVYETRTIKLMDTKAVALADQLFTLYEKDPALLPPEWYYTYRHVDNREGYEGSRNSETRVIVDYISNMTDRYALEEKERLFNPGVKI